jgi:hypothetical protein
MRPNLKACITSSILLRNPGLGWINTHVDVLKYTNFELKQVE